MTRHGEGGRDVGRGIVKDGAGVADGDANELDASPISSEDAKEGVVLLGILGELVVAAEVPAESDLEEEEGAVLAVEGVEVRRGVGWHSLGVDDVRGGSHSCRHQAVEVLLWELPKPVCTGRPPRLLRRIALHPLAWRESLCLWTHQLVPHSEHASMGANLYLYANLTLYS